MAVRLVSGTTSIGWDNLYDVRQYYNGLTATGTSGGISSIPIQDEGVPQGNATTFNFTGGGVQATISGAVVNVAVSSTPIFQRNLTQDLSLSDRESLVVAGYVNMNGHNITQLGDSRIYIL